jgi:hypothetical protein
MAPVTGLILAVVVEAMVGQYSGGVMPLANLQLFQGNPHPSNMRLDSLARIVWTCAISGTLALVSASGRRRHRELAGAAHAGLASLIVVQAFWAADVQINGQQALMARADKSLVPTERPIDDFRMAPRK